jgi:hypothetical protein
MRMSESLVGWSDAMTRQNAGTLASAGFGAALAWASGGVNAPAGCALADKILVFGSVIVERLSHVAARAGAGLDAVPLIRDAPLDAVP